MRSTTMRDIVRSSTNYYRVRVRCLSSASTSAPPDLILFQYMICPFCNISKALLSYSNTPYQIKEVNPLTKAQIKSLPTEYKKVPIALINEQQFNGSEAINEELLKQPSILHNITTKQERNSGDDNNFSVSDFSESENAKKWQNFARNELAPVLYPNICSSLSDSFKAFDYVKGLDSKDGFSPVQKVLIRSLGSLAMYFAASKIKSKRNITNEREALFDALDQWEEMGLDSGNNLFGSGLENPNMGDLAVYGVINSVSGLDAHAAMVERGGAVGKWYERMEREMTQ